MTERYKEYLQSAEWKDLKTRKLKKANFICDGCGETKGQMEVHHLTYERIGMELFTDLAVYCIECHKKAHSKVESTEWNKYLKGISDIKPKARLQKDIELERIINAI